MPRERGVCCDAIVRAYRDPLQLRGAREEDTLLDWPLTGRYRRALGRSLKYSRHPRESRDDGHGSLARARVD
ncbi:MAG: hypothetical protein J7495_19590 [Sphingomonas sp.]|nr:hypothetical protein [Sphingomonas sp.]